MTQNNMLSSPFSRINHPILGKKDCQFQHQFQTPCLYRKNDNDVVCDHEVAVYDAKVEDAEVRRHLPELTVSFV